MMQKLTTFILLMFSTFSLVQCADYNMLVGTYTRNTPSEGIYALTFDSKGALKSQKLLAKSDNPSFLAFSPDGKQVYAVNEADKASSVSAFSFNRKTPALTFINSSRVQNGACHVLSTEKHVFTANYGSGTISVLGRNPDGSLTDTLQVIVHPRVQFGRGRTGPSNAHQIILSPNGNYILATNLGTDRVFTYRYNPENSREILQYVDETKVKKRSGPRHATFSRDGKLLYLVQELDASVTVFRVADDGKLAIIQETTLVTDVNKKNGAADIHLSPDEKFLYATNRGEADNITCFKVNTDHTVTFVEQISTHGNHPRNFAISPDGKFIFVGNQKSNNIAVFSRNKRTGKMKLVRQDIQLGAPVCLLFY